MKTRQRNWAKAIASFLAKHRVRPNAISTLSIVFAAGAGAEICFSALIANPQRDLSLVTAAAFVQLRLLCNMLDGMVAMEGGLQTKSGAVFNDLPDRISDALIFVSIGYAVPGLPFGVTLGWLAALLSMLTAYVRMLGAASGLAHDFSGPMAKPQRMAAVTVACFLSTFEGSRIRHGRFLWLALAVIVAGCSVTIVRRTLHLLRSLEET